MKYYNSKWEIMKHLKIIQESPSVGGFIKSSDEASSNLSSQEKVLLNRKANVLFNNGDYLSAERIYMTTAYSDGLSRIADKYMDMNQELQALKFYWLAHNKRCSAPIISKLADLITIIIKQED